MIQIPGLNIEFLDVGYAVAFDGDTSRIYVAPGSDKLLQFIALRLLSAGVNVDARMSGPATPSAVVLTPTAAPVVPAPAVSESLFASLTSPSTARATLAAEFGETPFTSRMVSDLTGVEIGRCSVAISKLAEAGLIEAAGPRTKLGIPYRVAVASEAKPPEAPLSETEAAAAAEAFMDAVKDPEPEKAVEPDPTPAPEPEPEVAATVTEPEKVEEKPAPEKPAPTKTSDRALLVGQAETCKNAGWPREKALASLQRMAANHGAVDIADIEAILSSVYGAGEEEDAPF